MVKDTNNSLEVAYNDWDDNDSTTKVIKPLTLEEKAEKFKKTIDKLHKIITANIKKQDNNKILVSLLKAKFLNLSLRILKINSNDEKDSKIEYEIKKIE